MPDRRLRHTMPAALLLATLLTVGCKKGDGTRTDSAAGTVAPTSAESASTSMSGTGSASATIANVALGKRLGSDGRLSVSTGSFSPRDTIYLTVETTGASASSSLSARWRFENGQMVDSTSQQIAATSGGNGAVTAFHVANPKGWPPGRYTVEVFMDGRSVATKDFTVRR